MPCYRCGARQTDPGRGASPWKRGVRRDHQVLVCPGCQAGRDWAADLDHCPVCGAASLVCRLGEIECRACGHVHAASREEDGPAGGAPAPGLSEEVAAALDRLLRRGPAGLPPV